ncbi:Carboxylesterase type B [Alcanivorax balearicus MACL04]|uniref:Carboxylic ester hydrolase n=1 Tax=Alloalcanivorax balearicus MACL04 TaxID=1177182 RepID=A0ABT2QZ83_9GAMM|nr:carboxylesterase family protein [Alloalcanivorax balearicus]MCU5782833.1 Carboxylesterase type B [Alloalcanivorax balearicus MACL04]
MLKQVPRRRQRRCAAVIASLSSLLLLMSGCGGSSSSNSDGEQLAGLFGAIPISGVSYRQGDAPWQTTDELGQFHYNGDETLTFTLGDLTLGSTTGAKTLTIANLSTEATSAETPMMINTLVLLQTLDADGSLHNGIRITPQIRDQVSTHAASLDLDQPTTDFNAALQNVVDNLESAGAFSDTDSRTRRLTTPGDAEENFQRAVSPRQVVETNSGQLSGFEADEHTWQFLGIPYAKPPLGELRWRPPVEPEPWSGIRHAVAWSDQAAQNAALERFGEGGMSEDSLYLNVTAPKNADGLPVMVWFHGGGFTALTSNTKPFNNPGAVASKGVVQVSVNHRLGPFGYIAHSELSAESGYNGSGNYGQMDLIAALEWVRDNIEAFGGDPGNVTIFGESGGGRKVLSLMASPRAAGLFHRAISQSGTLYPDTRSLAAAEAVGGQLQTELGASSLAEMREKSWQEVAAAAATLTPYTNIDNHYLPYAERVAFESGNQNDVPFMFSINANDTPDPTNTAIEVFPWMTPLCSANHYATYFTHQPSGWKARGVEAYHAAELAYVFNMPESVITHYLLGLVIDPATGDSLVIGDLNGNGVSGSQGDPADILVSAGFDQTDQAVIDRMLTIWTNFAKTGDPSIEGDVDYPLYDAASESYVEIGASTEAKTGLGDVLSD